MGVTKESYARERKKQKEQSSGKKKISMKRKNILILAGSAAILIVMIWYFSKPAESLGSTIEVEAIAGEFIIDSAPRQGTLIKVVFPMHSWQPLLEQEREDKTDRPLIVWSFDSNLWY